MFVCKIGFLDFVHRLNFNKITAFQKLGPTDRVSVLFLFFFFT
jgi:hypothetical protein